MNYTAINLGQVEMIKNLFEDNPNLFGQLTYTDFAYFIQLIKIHGKYHEFLEFYDTILDTAEKLSGNSDLHKIVL